MITHEDIERHRMLDMQANKMTADAFRAKQERERKEQEFVDRVSSDRHEDEEAILHAAGITKEEANTLFDRRGYDFAVQIIRYLSEHVSTPDDAVEDLYRIAGDEAGEYVDMLTRAFGRRVRQFGPDLVGDLSTAEFNHDYPRKKYHRPSKSDVIALYEAWKQMQDMQSGFDASIDESMLGRDTD